MSNAHGFGLKFEQALRLGAQARGDEVIEIADEAPPVFANAWEAAAFEQQRKARMDARKWHNAKIDPKIWGDHKTLDVTVNAPMERLSSAELQAIAARSGLVIDHEPLEPSADSATTEIDDIEA